MTSLLERKLLVVAGKGGVGRTTIASAIGLLAAGRGLRTLVVEVAHQDRLPELFGLAAQGPGIETELREGLWSLSIDSDRALLEWLQALGGRVSGRLLASSSTFQYFTAAAPGAKELVSMVKIWELTQGKRRHGRTVGYDLVVLDAPATGHALGLLQSPRTFGAIARVGPIAAQARQVQELLEDPARCGYLAVAQGTEMAVIETVELDAGLRRELDRRLHAVIVNAVLPRRFTGPELARLAQLSDGVSARPPRTRASRHRPASDSLIRSATLAARAVHQRARYQHNQIARLRRRRFDVVSIPFQFGAELDLPALTRIAEHLSRRL
jgi:anion-transporting  ArsA/GET3 family ATPase